jgi:putative methyltransferase (TIGR04325 family)
MRAGSGPQYSQLMDIARTTSTEVVRPRWAPARMRPRGLLARLRPDRRRGGAFGSRRFVAPAAPFRTSTAGVVALFSGVWRAARGRAASLVRAALRAPGVHGLRKANAARSFRRKNAPGNPFFGVFGSLEEAKAAVPPGASDSYDSPAAGELYRERLERVFPHDYPVLFWMKPILPDVRRVFDLGGHVGIANYTYERYLGALASVEWTVCDVPSVVEAGRRIAASRGRRGLSFTTRYEDASGADVLFGSGVLQYLTNGFLPDLLSRLPVPPRHLFINLLPTTDKPTFFTLNNIQAAICPYLVMNEREFVASIVRLGYRQIDSWSTPEKKCIIPLYPDRSVHAYRGFYFGRDGASTGLVGAPAPASGGAAPGQAAR